MLESMRERGIPPPHLDEGDLSDLSAYLRQIGQSGPQERVLLAPGNPNLGRELFTTKGCAVCHGETDAAGRGAPDLRFSDLHRSADAIAGTMWNHAGPMSTTMREAGVGWPSFTTAELADLVAYIYFLPFSDPAGDPARGASVFRERSCAGCHGDAERGASGAPSLVESAALGTSAEMVAAMWNHAPLMREAILGEGLPWPELSGRDLRDLRAYLKRVAGEPPARPGR
jgi:mono/diheme cytochrome c family protein